jgi:molybdopterin-synthase adenylyltransferase
MFTEEQIERYSRHIILKEVGGKGQKKLLAGKVLIIGAGGLGSPVALYLAAAGVGTIGIADADVVDLSNLQRQVIHHTSDIGKPKVLSAKEKMEAINPDVKVNVYQTWINAENILDIIKDYDFVVDGTDNFAAKFLINDACVLAGKPYSHGGILHFIGQTMTVKPGTSPCYRCVFPAPPPPDSIPSCSQAGVIGVLPGVIGSIQATEAVKFLIGVGELLTGRLLIYDAEGMDFRNVKLKRNPRCPVCGENPSILELKDELEALNVCDLKENTIQV